MPTVTRLEAVGSRGDRVRVHLDGEPLCRVDADVVARLELEAGTELTEDRVRELLHEGRAREALDRAFSYLSHRSRSRFEVERHLRSKGFERPAVEAALERCEELGYLDDRAFAAGWVRDRIRLKPRGRFRLRMELKEKGVSEADAEAAIDRAFREAGVDERELLERAARKRWEARRSDDPRTLKRRLAGYLKRRGFRSADVWEVVHELLEEIEDGPGGTVHG
jgi:regulatory protein